MEILRSGEGELHHILSGQSVLADRPLDVGGDIPSRDILLLSWTDASRKGDPSVVLACDESQAANSSHFKKGSRTPPKHNTKRRKTSLMRTRLGAAKASSDDIPVIDLEIHREQLPLVLRKC